MRYFEDNNINTIFEPKNELNLSNDTQIKNEIWAEDSVSSAARIVCVLLLRLGFILVQIGSIPIENVYIIIFRNIIEMAAAIFSYGFLGFYISYGMKTFYGAINYDGFIGDKNADLNAATVGFCACLIGSAITSSFLVARLHQLPMLVITCFTSSIFQPTLMCWCWSKYGWMTKYTLLEERVQIKDHGGNLVVHIPSATIGVIGAIFLGRRIMKVKDVDRFSLGTEYISGTVVGYMFIIIGHIGFYLPSRSYLYHHTVKDHISHISVNSLMAMGTGILVVSLLQMLVAKDVYKYWIMVKCLQGALAGVVTVAAGIDIYSPPISFGIATFGAFIFFVVSNLVHYSALEDCCNITAIYLICGITGILIPPLLANDENLGLSISIKLRLVHLLWQFLCLLIVFVLTSLLYLLIYTILYAFGILTNKFEKVNHQRAKILYGRLPWRRYFDRIFMISGKSKEISPESNRTEMSQTFTAI